MNKRPLSPHIQIYRLPLTAMMSITHRITGVLLVFGVILLAIFLTGVAEGGERFAQMQLILRSGLGRLLLWIWIFTLFVHLCHGLRHLIWDTGHGFDRVTLIRFAYLEIAAAVALTTMVGTITFFRS